MSNPLIQSAPWQALQTLAASQAGMHLRERFAADPARFSHFSLRAEGMLADYSKQRIDAQVMAQLHALWSAADVPGWSLSELYLGDRLLALDDAVLAPLYARLVDDARQLPRERVEDIGAAENLEEAVAVEKIEQLAALDRSDGTV